MEASRLLNRRSAAGSNSGEGAGAQDGRPEELDFVIRKNPTPDDLNSAAAQSGTRIASHQISIHRKAEDR